MPSLTTLNTLPASDFTAALSGIFEHSPWIPAQVAAARPFASVEALHAALCQVLAAAGEEKQLDLIRAHPELAGRAAIRGELTEASTREQRGAGLDQCSPEEYAELQRLNAAYQARFGFPFILAVRGHTRQSILEQMAARLHHDRAREIATAIGQIERIAAFRLGDLLTA